MVRTVCAPLILCALTSPARSYATRCSLLPPRSGEACKARHATWGCVQSQAATAGALLELRPLANACLCEALGRQTRGSFDFCGPAEEQHSWTCDCTPRRPSTVPANASSRSWTSAAAAGRGPSDAVPAAPSGRLVLIGRRCCAGPRRPPQPVALFLSAPAVAAPHPCAPAVAVELLRKARLHAPFARPATVRGRVSGRIGPLGTWIAASGGASRWQNTSLGRSHWARAQPPAAMGA